MREAPVVLFDGVCNFCNASVSFLLDHERDDRMRFATLQSALARDLIAEIAGEEAAREIVGTNEPSSMAFIEDGKLYTLSAAALRIARHLRAPWRWLRVFAIVPRPIRDFFYRVLARNRYRWFGKTEQCRVPTHELRARFLA